MTVNNVKQRRYTFALWARHKRLQTSVVRGHSFRRGVKGEGVKQKRTHGSTYAKTSLFCTCFVIFSYAGSFYHTLLSLA